MTDKKETDFFIVHFKQVRKYATSAPSSAPPAPSISVFGDGSGGLYLADKPVTCSTCLYNKDVSPPAPRS